MMRSTFRYNSIRQGTLLFLTIVLGCVSCSKDWLEEKPDKKMTVPGTLSDYQGMLDNAADLNQNVSCVGEIASDGHYVTDIVYQNATKTPFTDGYIWSRTVTHDATASSGSWEREYKMVLYTNIVLDGLTKIIPSDNAESEIWRNIKGQALFIRGMTFFRLAQIYALPYSEENASSSLGLILRLNTDINEVSRRSSLQATYDQIIKDLSEAVDLLPDRPKILTRASKSAAHALLARVYLSLSDYEKALFHSDASLKIYSLLLDFNTLSKTANFIERYNREVLYHVTMRSHSFIAANCLIDPDLFAMYDEHDLRRIILCRKNASGAIQFKGNYNSSSTILFCGLATDEMYLTRAECFARTGKVDEAMDDLNTLLRSRWSNAVEYTERSASNAEAALRLVLDERFKELMLRGIRWTDLRRLNNDPRFARTLSRVVLGNTYTIEPNSYKYSFPMPEDIVQMTGIQQNPGWTD